MKKRWIVLIIIAIVLVLLASLGYVAYRKVSSAAISEGVSDVLKGGVIVMPSEDGETVEETTVEEYLKEDSTGENISQNFPEGTRVELPEVGIDPETGKTASVPIEALDKNNQKQLEALVSPGDRARVIGILARGLPADQYSRVMALAVPPITSAKIGTGISILKKYMKGSDIKELKAIGYKYIHLLDDILSN